MSTQQEVVDLRSSQVCRPANPGVMGSIVDGDRHSESVVVRWQNGVEQTVRNTELAPVYPPPLWVPQTDGTRTAVYESDCVCSHGEIHPHHDDENSDHQHGQPDDAHIAAIAHAALHRLDDLDEDLANLATQTRILSYVAGNNARFDGIDAPALVKAAHDINTLRERLPEQVRRIAAMLPDVVDDAPIDFDVFVEDSTLLEDEEQVKEFARGGFLEDLDGDVITSLDEPWKFVYFAFDWSGVRSMREWLELRGEEFQIAFDLAVKQFAVFTDYASPRWHEVLDETPEADAPARSPEIGELESRYAHELAILKRFPHTALGVRARVEGFALVLIDGPRTELRATNFAVGLAKTDEEATDWKVTLYAIENDRGDEKVIASAENADFREACFTAIERAGEGAIRFDRDVQSSRPDGGTSASDMDAPARSIGDMVDGDTAWVYPGVLHLDEYGSYWLDSEHPAFDSPRPGTVQLDRNDGEFRIGHAPDIETFNAFYEKKRLIHGSGVTVSSVVRDW